MAMLDHRRVTHQKALREADEKMTEFLKTSEGRKIFPDWINFVKFQDQQDDKIEQLEEEVKRYQNFFDTLSSLLPRKFTIHDKLY